MIDYRQRMHRARLLLLLLVLAAGITACDDSSHHAEHGGRLYTGGEVRRAFTKAGIRLVPDSTADAFPELRASFQGDDDIFVLVYNTAGSKVVALLQNQASAGRRNLIVTYPKGSRLQPNIRRALVMLDRATDPAR